MSRKLSNMWSVRTINKKKHICWLLFLQPSGNSLVLREITICSQATNNYNMFYLLFIFCCKELKQIILRCWHVLLLQDRVRENRCQSLQNCLRRWDITHFRILDLNRPYDLWFSSYLHWPFWLFISITLWNTQLFLVLFKKPFFCFCKWYWFFHLATQLHLDIFEILIFMEYLNECFYFCADLVAWYGNKSYVIYSLNYHSSNNSKHFFQGFYPKKPVTIEFLAWKSWKYTLQKSSGRTVLTITHPSTATV